ncbi:Putative N-acetyltransferase [Magnetospirillum gryphiswaldense MSR-1 v2]|uniref:N-acetyltransferase n=1 Tax=Magnetospirillum gryphiswaldense (strain DSM 6361 / JCM 21280 / NBRC 15271 / MSR-1) TaxID=431944 RepID=V6F3X3_MAGGM|nr:GNAT family N-acetyltransferase [Magnetospirillum gryphiswaldense]CDL00092.1 Putative N-acetyltransferase [Magnetospirillum gryphiswaldense MSR-1 v2]
MTIRTANPDDAPHILALLHELAAFEGGTVTAGAHDLRAALESRRMEALLAEQAGESVGLLTVLPSYSSWRGQAGAIIHDLYVRPAARGLGLGRKLVHTLLALAPERGWGRVDVNVLDWNQTAQQFYAQLGLVPATGWQIWRIEGEALEKPYEVQ